MPGYVKKAGTWESLKRPHAKLAGTWKQIAKAYTKRSGAWERWYSAGAPVLPTPTAITTFRIRSVAIDSTNKMTFTWKESPAIESVIDYEFVCVPYHGGAWLGSDPFMANTPPAFAADGGVFQTYTVPAVTPDASIDYIYDGLTRNGVNKSWRVRARNAFGYGPWSDIIFCETNAASGSAPLQGAPDVQIVSQTLINPGATNAYFSTTVKGLLGLNSTLAVGATLPGAISNLPAIQTAVSHDGTTDQITVNNTSGSANPYRGSFMCPAIRIRNPSNSTSSYAIFFTTQPYTDIPLLATDIVDYFTLTVGQDLWESDASFRDRGYIINGAHENAQQVGTLTPPTILISTLQKNIVSLVRAGQISGSFEVDTTDTPMSKWVNIGYGTFDSPEQSRLRPTSTGSRTPQASAPWGEPEWAWSGSLGSWQFVVGQTYTIKMVRSAIS